MIFEPIESDRLVVRELSEGDREGLMKFVREPEQLRYMLFSMKTAGDADGFIGLAKKTAVDAARRDYYMAVDAKTESGRGYIGSVSLMGDEEGASAELGYFYHREVWGKGYAVEAARLLVDFGFRKLGLHRVWGKCHSENAASARVMERLGMVREGILREHAWMGDHYRSSLVYGILDREWEALKREP